jgi:hypothetical protein
MGNAKTGISDIKRKYFMLSVKTRMEKELLPPPS